VLNKGLYFFFSNIFDSTKFIKKYARHIFFRTCEAMCGKTTMDKFRVCILMVEVALNEAKDGFVCESFHGREVGNFESTPGTK